MRGFLQLAPLFRAAVISQAVGDAARRHNKHECNSPLGHSVTPYMARALPARGQVQIITVNSPKSESMYAITNI